MTLDLEVGDQIIIITLLRGNFIKKALEQHFCKTAGRHFSAVLLFTSFLMITPTIYPNASAGTF